MINSISLQPTRLEEELPMVAKYNAEMIGLRGIRVAAQTVAEYKVLDDKTLTKRIKKLEKEMLDAAKNLEFEKAAELRDQLKQLKQVLFGVEEHD